MVIHTWHTNRMQNVAVDFHPNVKKKHSIQSLVLGLDTGFGIVLLVQPFLQVRVLDDKKRLGNVL